MKFFLLILLVTESPWSMWAKQGEAGPASAKSIFLSYQNYTRFVFTFTFHINLWDGITPFPPLAEHSFELWWGGKRVRVVSESIEQNLFNQVKHIPQNFDNPTLRKTDTLLIFGTTSISGSMILQDL